MLLFFFTFFSCFSHLPQICCIMNAPHSFQIVSSDGARTFCPKDTPLMTFANLDKIFSFDLCM